MGQGCGTAWFLGGVLVLRGRQGYQPGWLVFGECRGYSGCYDGARDVTVELR
jgi:hypothetical protein